jgi:hypothetical protein
LELRFRPVSAVFRIDCLTIDVISSIFLSTNTAREQCRFGEVSWIAVGRGADEAAGMTVQHVNIQFAANT